MKWFHDREDTYVKYSGDIIKYVYKDMEFNDEWSRAGSSNFKDAQYSKCSFKGVKFSEATFSNVIFEDCDFEDCDFMNCEIECQEFLQIYRCNLNRINIEKCKLPHFHIKECSLLRVNFKDAVMSGCNLINNSYIEVTFIDNCNLMDAVIQDNNKFMNIRFINEKSYTRLNYGTYIGKFKYKGKSLDEKEILKINEAKRSLDISNTYMEFGEQFLRNNVCGKYGVCFYESKVAFHDTLRGKRKFISGAYNIVCGYGEKPWRTFMLSLALILIFGILYMITGIKMFNNELISLKILEGNMSIVNFVRLLIYCIYFSVVTFATVGYGDIMVANTSGMIVSIIEIVVGVFMIGVWTSTIVRKMTR